VPGRHTLQQRAFPASSVIWRSFWSVLCCVVWQKFTGILWFCQTTRCYISGDSTFHDCCHENLKSNMEIFICSILRL
jgi:fatty acid desaturase